MALPTPESQLANLKTKTTQDERVLAIIAPTADDLGYDIVRVRVMGGKRSTLQVMAERKSDGEMEVGDCERLSRAISTVLEVEDPIAEAYHLEVSSPGLDRPLTRLEDFETWSGHLARVELDRMVEGRKRFRGIIDGVENGHIALVLDGEEDAAQIPFDWVSDAKLLITDALIEAGQKAKAAKQQTQKQTMTTSEETD